MKNLDCTKMPRTWWFIDR